MAKLTHTQLVVLSKAAAREDGLAVAPTNMKGAAAAKVGLSLVARKLMREIKAKPGTPVWRKDKEGRPICLMITRAGRDAIGVDEDQGERSDVPVKNEKAQRKPAAVVKKPSKANPAVMPSAQLSTPRENSKQARVINMLSAQSGATLDDLIAATGWLPHTTRAALTGLRKRGFAIERSRAEGETSIYRLVGSTASAAA
jgi:hypothetical protein